MRQFIYFLSAIVLVTGCGTTSGGGGGVFHPADTTGDGDASTGIDTLASDTVGADTVIPGDSAQADDSLIMPTDGTGYSVVDRLGAASSACGKQSMFTVPGGWNILAVGNAGCTVWVPPGWTLTGAYTGIASAIRDGSGSEGFVGIAGATQEVTCAPEPVRDSVLQGFTAKGFSAPQVLWHYEQSQEFGGTVWPTGHTVFGSAVSGTALVGYLWVMTTQTVVACDVVSLGFWEPESAIETDTCTLTQILNSVKCPSGGGCDSGSCDADCKAGGAAGGSCDAGGNCSCY